MSGVSRRAELSTLTQRCVQRELNKTGADYSTSPLSTTASL